MASLLDQLSEFPDAQGQVEMALRVIRDDKKLQEAAIQFPFRLYFPLKPTLEREQFDIALTLPLRFTPKKLQEDLSKWIKNLPGTREDLVEIFWDLVSRIALKDEGDYPDLEVLLVVQMIVRLHGRTVLRTTEVNGQMAKYLEGPDPPKKTLSPHLVPTFLWIFSQSLASDPKLSLLLWFQFLLPPPFFPQFGGHFRQQFYWYVDRLIAIHKGELASKLESKSVDKLELLGFERLLILNFLEDDPELSRVFDLVKGMTIFLSDKTPRYYFEMLLSHAATERSLRDRELIAQVVQLLLECLKIDPSCFVLWTKIYPRFVAPSNNVLVFMLNNLDDVTDEVASESVISNLVTSLIDTNKRLISGTFKYRMPRGMSVKMEIKINKMDIDACNTTCKALQKRCIQSSRRRHVPLFLLFLIFLALFVAWYLQPPSFDSDLDPLLAPPASP